MLWLDNRQPPNFEPLVGKFENGVGRFYSTITTQDGRLVHVRFLLDHFTEESLHWQFEFLFSFHSRFASRGPLAKAISLLMGLLPRQ